MKYIKKIISAYDRFVPHRIGGVSLLKEKILSPELSTTYKMFLLQVFLVDWLVNHTTKEDRHLGKFLLLNKE